MVKKIGLFASFGVVLFVITACGGSTNSIAGANATSSSGSNAVQANQSEKANHTLTKITIAQTSDALGWAADDLALKEGFFKKEGLDADIQVMTGGDAAALPAVISGNAQFGAVTSISTLEAIGKGQNLKIIAPFTDQFVSEFIIRKDLAEKLGITDQMPVSDKIKKIKGLKVGTPDIGGSIHLLFNGLVKKNGLDPNKDFTVTAIHPYPTELDALKRGQIDVALVPIPYGDIAVKDGYAVMLANFWGGAVPEFSGAVHQTMFVTDQYAEAHPDVVEAVRRALADALQFIHQHPDQAVKDLQEMFPKTDPDIIKKIVVTEAEGYPTDSSIPRKGFDILRDFTAQYVDPSVGKVTYENAVWKTAQTN
ncbi:MAG: ABC transporter substrate-binding protein [Alicyclobacillus sp.]|nr:ABC transporter substrate-binding protein [Alicyclobacillus sp.]